MKKIEIDLNDPQEKKLQLIADHFYQGQVIAYPTDTIYGLGCLATNREAVRKIHRIKNRPVDKPLLVLISDWEMLKDHFYVNSDQEQYLKKYWPGAFSFLLPSRGKMTVDADQNDAGVVVRLPKNDFLIKMIERIDTPITSTSLNISGEETIKEVSNIQNYIDTNNIDLIVNGGHLSGEASSIIDIRDINNIKHLR